MSDVSFDPAALEPGPVDLSDFDAEFEAIEPASRDAVPDGKYKARVNKAVLGYSKNGTPMVKWDLVIIAGEHARRHLFKNSAVTRESMPYLKRELQTVGLEKVRLSDLHTHLDEIVGVELEVAKRTKDEDTNVYFNKRVGSAAAEPTGVGDESF